MHPILDNIIEKVNNLMYISRARWLTVDEKSTLIEDLTLLVELCHTEFKTESEILILNKLRELKTFIESEDPRL